jgi:hypothetical protein
MAIPEGYEIIKPATVPEGYELISPPTSQSVNDDIPEGYERIKSAPIPPPRQSEALPGADVLAVSSPTTGGATGDFSPDPRMISELGSAGKTLAANLLLPKGWQNLKQVDRSTDNLMSGVIGSAGSVAAGVDWAIGSETFKQLSDKADEWVRDKQPVDPTLIDEFEQAAGSAIFYVIPGLVTGATSVQLAKVVPKLALLFGSTVSTVLESGAEAGSIYKTVLAKTGDKELANSAANKTFMANAFLIGLTNKFGIFGDRARGIAKFGLSALLEGFQEGGQEVISSLVQGMKPKLKEIAKSGIFGALLGGPMGGAAELATRLSQPRMDTTITGNQMKESEIQQEEAEVIKPVSAEETLLNEMERASRRLDVATEETRDAVDISEADNVRVDQLLKEEDKTRELALEIAAGIKEFGQDPTIRPDPQAFERVSFEDAVVEGIQDIAPTLGRKQRAPLPYGGFEGSTGVHISNIRETIEQTNYSELTGKRKAQSVIFRDLKKEVNRAVKEGQKQGGNKTKLTNQIKADVTRQHKLVINKMKKDVKYLKLAEKSVKNLPSEFQSLVGEMTKGMDFQRRTAKTLEQRRKILHRARVLAQRGVDIGIPIKTLRQAYSKPLQEMTPNEVAGISNAVRAIVHEGRTEGRMLKLAERKAQDQLMTEFETETADKPTLRKDLDDPVTTAQRTVFNKLRTSWRGVRRLGRQFADWNNRVPRLLEELDGQINGPIRITLWTNGINKAENDYSRNKMTYEDNLHDRAQQAGIDWDVFSQVQRHISEKVGSLTGDEIVGVYTSLGDDKKMSELMKTNGFNEGDISDIVGKITPEERAFADSERAEFWDKLYGEVNPVFESVKGRPLARHPGFSHIVRIRGTKNFKIIREEDLMDQVWGEPQYRKPTTDTGIVKGRTLGSENKVSLSYIDTVLSAMDQSSRYRAFAETSRDTRKIMADPRFRKIVDERMGPQFHSLLDKWLVSSSTGKLSYQDSLSEALLKLHRNRFTTFLLGYRIVSAMKAPISIINAIGLTDAGSVVSALEQVTMKYDEMRKMAFHLSPQLAFRAGGERDLQSLLAKAQALKVFTGKEMAPHSLRMYKHVDEFSVLTSWHGAFNHHQKNNPGVSPQESADYALDVVLRTQPAPALKDLPQFFKEGELAKQFTFLGNQRNQNALTFSHDIGKLWRLGAISSGEAMRRLMWLSIVSYVYGTIARGRLDRTLGEGFADLVSTYLGGIFMVGNLVIAMANRWQFKAPMYAGLRELGTTGINIIKTITGDEEAGSIVSPLTNSIGIFLGIPIDAPRRQLKGLVDISAGTDPRLRRLLGYSKRQLDLPDAKKSSGDLFGSGRSKRARDLFQKGRSNGLF